MKTLAMVLVAAGLGCTVPGAGDGGDGDGGGTDVVPLDWGVVDDCGEAEDAGFDDWYDTDRAVLVRGDSAADGDFADQVCGWYCALVNDFQVKAASDLTEDDRTANLFIVGSPDTNPLLAELNGALPVWFEDGAFTFGGYRYDEPGNGIALVHPSPFDDDAMVLIYAGNTLAGAYSTFTVWTGQADFETTRGRGVVMQEGGLCRDGELWGFHELYADDYREDWEDWLAQLDSTESAHHVFHYLPDSDPAEEIDWYPDWQEEQYDLVLSTLQVDALDFPVQTYLYPDNATKGEITGSRGNGHANDLNYEVHEVWGDGVAAIGAHEDVHVVAWHRIGAGQTALMGEGLAVMVGGEWWCEDLESWVVAYRDSGELPALSDLVNDFWSTDDTVTYPVAGHFVTWLATQWDMDTVKALYVAEDLQAAFEDELGMSAEEVEQAWLASLP